MAKLANLLSVASEGSSNTPTRYASDTHLDSFPVLTVHFCLWDLCLWCSKHWCEMTFEYSSQKQCGGHSGRSTELTVNMVSVSGLNWRRNPAPAWQPQHVVNNVYIRARKEQNSITWNSSETFWSFTADGFLAANAWNCSSRVRDGKTSSIDLWGFMISDDMKLLRLDFSGFYESVWGLVSLCACPWFRTAACFDFMESNNFS